jgi:hypothetical protein
VAAGAQAQLRARALAIVAGDYGCDDAHTFSRERFIVAGPDTTPERSEARERTADVAFEPEQVLDHRPQCNTKLYIVRMSITVAYVVTGAGEDYDAAGGESGAGDVGAVEDRAAQDAHELTAMLAWQPQWTGLVGVDVIDAAPALNLAPTGAVLLTGRTYVRTTYIDFTLRVGSPGSLGPQA